MTGRLVRLLLLFCTLVGLTAMHTLGHGAHAPADHPAHVRTGHAADRHPAVVPPAMEPMSDCAGDGCRARLLPLGEAGGAPSGWDVCLAVLGAFAVALLVAGLLRSCARSAGHHPGGPAGRVVGPRAPPPRRYGLRLATVSVLRT
ncbi:hypothetical protein GA0070611_5113 [Micromonospora auratinigra]|uniref:MYXO-CTERM domain-containing protein n=1 Tax=Micromonospora auratinigra TaxID=261654 RepID=A0A1A9A540_9ACTN|nr:hypothetical protein GA0070611_5113 [Micromonospora auratinigra]